MATKIKTQEGTKITVTGEGWYVTLRLKNKEDGLDEEFELYDDEFVVLAHALLKEGLNLG